MKDKVLKSNLTHAVEHFAKELRAYSKDSLVCQITIITKSTGVEQEVGLNPKPAPDWYKVRVVPTEAVDQYDSIVDESAKIFYGYDHYGNEGILQVVPYEEDKSEEEEDEHNQP